MKEKQFYDENEQKRINKLVDDMTLFDDDLMSHVFDKNIEATELINVIQIRFFMMKTVYHMRSCIENTVQLRNAVFFRCTNA